MAKKAKEEDTEKDPVPTEQDGLIFVNTEKLARAKSILSLVSGKTVPKNDQEAEKKDTYTAHLASAEIGVKDEGALRFIYEKLLGGLVRTPAEQEEVDEAAKEAAAKNKKKAVEE